jgi:hypothetical protein
MLTKDSVATLTMKEAKGLGLKAAGQVFECHKSPYYAGGVEGVPTGSLGMILPELSARGKLQAELTCAEEGCAEIHVREVSDWHQCNKCQSHSKSKGKSRSPGMQGIGGQRSVKLPDGTVLRELQVPEGADEEMKALVAENNALFEQFKKLEDERKEAEAAQRKAEAAKKAEELKAQKEAELAKARKEQAIKALELARKIAAERGVAVSPKLVEAAEAMEETGS